MGTKKGGRPYRHIKAQKKVKEHKFCAMCLAEGKLNRDGLEGDHAGVPYALGGSSDGANMRALCETHHIRRHGKTPKSEEGKPESENVYIEMY